MQDLLHVILNNCSGILRFIGLWHLSTASRQNGNFTYILDGFQAGDVVGLAIPLDYPGY